MHWLTVLGAALAIAAWANAQAINVTCPNMSQADCASNSSWCTYCPLLQYCYNSPLEAGCATSCTALSSAPWVCLSAQACAYVPGLSLCAAATTTISAQTVSCHNITDTSICNAALACSPCVLGVGGAIASYCESVGVPCAASCPAFNRDQAMCTLTATCQYDPLRLECFAGAAPTCAAWSDAPAFCPTESDQTTSSSCIFCSPLGNCLPSTSNSCAAECSAFTSSTLCAQVASCQWCVSVGYCTSVGKVCSGTCTSFALPPSACQASQSCTYCVLTGQCLNQTQGTCPTNCAFVVGELDCLQASNCQWCPAIQYCTNSSNECAASCDTIDSSFDCHGSLVCSLCAPVMNCHNASRGPAGCASSCQVLTEETACSFARKCSYCDNGFTRPTCLQGTCPQQCSDVPYALCPSPDSSQASGSGAHDQCGPCTVLEYCGALGGMCTVTCAALSAANCETASHCRYCAAVKGCVDSAVACPLSCLGVSVSSSPNCSDFASCKACQAMGGASQATCQASSTTCASSCSVITSSVVCSSYTNCMYCGSGGVNFCTGVGSYNVCPACCEAVVSMVDCANAASCRSCDALQYCLPGITHNNTSSHTAAPTTASTSTPSPTNGSTCRDVCYLLSPEECQRPLSPICTYCAALDYCASRRASGCPLTCSELASAECQATNGHCRWTGSYCSSSACFSFLIAGFNAQPYLLFLVGVIKDVVVLFMIGLVGERVSLSAVRMKYVLRRACCCCCDSKHPEVDQKAEAVHAANIVSAAVATSWTVPLLLVCQGEPGPTTYLEQGFDQYVSNLLAILQPFVIADSGEVRVLGSGDALPLETRVRCLRLVLIYVLLDDDAWFDLTQMRQPDTLPHVGERWRLSGSQWSSPSGIADVLREILATRFAAARRTVSYGTSQQASRRLYISLSAYPGKVQLGLYLTGAIILFGTTLWYVILGDHASLTPASQFLLLGFRIANSSTLSTICLVLVKYLAVVRPWIEEAVRRTVCRGPSPKKVWYDFMPSRGTVSDLDRLNPVAVYTELRFRCSVLVHMQSGVYFGIALPFALVGVYGLVWYIYIFVGMAMLGFALWLAARKLRAALMRWSQRGEGEDADGATTMRDVPEFDQRSCTLQTEQYFLLENQTSSVPQLHDARGPAEGTTNAHTPLVTRSKNRASHCMALTVSLLEFLSNQTIPTLVMVVVIQASFNYTILIMYGSQYGVTYADTPRMEYSSRTTACVLYTARRELSVLQHDLSHALQLLCSFIPFM